MLSLFPFSLVFHLGETFAQLMRLMLQFANIYCSGVMPCLLFRLT